jgi:hypothetical protein
MGKLARVLHSELSVTIEVFVARQPAGE